MSALSLTNSRPSTNAVLADSNALLFWKTYSEAKARRSRSWLSFCFGNLNPLKRGRMAFSKVSFFTSSCAMYALSTSSRPGRVEER